MHYFNLFDFASESSVASWRPVDDQVMGGVSTSEMVWDNGHAIFQGVVSPENNGGFASVRSTVDSALLKSSDHLWVNSRGDGNLYSLLVRTSKTPAGINYQADFRPSSDFTRIELPLTEFKAQFRGRPVADAPALSAEDILQLGIMISDKQFGAFRLAVVAIGTAIGVADVDGRE